MASLRSPSRLSDWLSLPSGKFQKIDWSFETPRRHIAAGSTNAPCAPAGHRPQTCRPPFPICSPPIIYSAFSGFAQAFCAPAATFLRAGQARAHAAAIRFRPKPPDFRRNQGVLRCESRLFTPTAHPLPAARENRRPAPLAEGSGSGPSGPLRPPVCRPAYRRPGP